MEALENNFIDSNIGYWTVLKIVRTSNNGRKKIKCKCRCICGKEKLVSIYSLKRGDSNSCGCKINRTLKGINLWKEKNGPPNKKDTGIAILNTVFNSYRTSARNKNLDFSLTKEQIKNFIKENCHYCNGIPLDKYVSRMDLVESGKFYRNGIDRKDNNIGYVFNNCVTCCKKCNYLKRDLNYNEFITLITSIVNNLRNENEEKKF